MLILIIFIFNLSCYFLNNDVEISPKRGYTDLGGCQNFSIRMSDNSYEIKKSIIFNKDNTTSLDLYGADTKQKYQDKQIFLLNYIHSFDARWVTLCDIDGNAEGIYVKFILKKDKETEEYSTDIITPDYCTRSKRCKKLYLPRDETYLPEKSVLDEQKNRLYIYFKKPIAPIKKNVSLFALFSTINLENIQEQNNYIVNDHPTVIELAFWENRVNIIQEPLTLNYRYIIIVYFDDIKFYVIKTQVIFTEQFISTPVYASNSLTFNITNSKVKHVEYFGTIFFEKTFKKINKNKSNDSIVINIDSDKGSYAAVWVAFVIDSGLYAKGVSEYYLNFKIEIKTGVVTKRAPGQPEIIKKTKTISIIGANIRDTTEAEKVVNSSTATGDVKIRCTGIAIFIGVIAAIFVVLFIICAILSPMKD